MKGIEGSTLGRYELRRRIAQGGMSEVYLGYDRRVKRRVAVKVLYASDEPFVRRFEREALAIGTLSHDHILPLYDFGEQRPWYYLVMPYVEGGTLRDYLLKRERLTLEEAGSFLEQIASALQCAHDHGVIHRDVKPSNILLRSDGYAYLGDFGLAKAKMGTDALTHAGTMIGTPEYMAPEQSNGIHDYRGDIYSLGIILYQMLTGRVPFIADSPVAISLKHIQTQPLPPCQLNSEIPASIEAVMLKALAKNADERYQQASLLATAYQKALLEEQAQRTDETTANFSKSDQDYSNAGTIRIALKLPLTTQITPISEPGFSRSKASPRIFSLLPRRATAPLAPGDGYWRSRRRNLPLIFIALLTLLILSIIIPLGLIQQSTHIASQGQQKHTTPTRTPDHKATAHTQALARQQATLAAQAHVQATAGITSAIGVGKILYTNEMTSPGGGWLNDGRQCSFSSQGYHVSTDVHTAAWCYFNQYVYSNIAITTQAQLLRGDVYGLVFRLSAGSKTFYVLELNSQGEYRFIRAQGNNPYNWLTLIDWTHSNAIRSGYGQINTFLVIAQNTQFTVYINKHLIIPSFVDAAYTTGMVGFLVGGNSQGGTEAVFSKLWIFQK